jgi:N-acetylglucosaminyl-diphospho-decaprenol L-rhamnosyltransferase
VGARRQPGHLVRARSIDELLEVARRWPRSGALGPRIHTAEGLLYPSARELPSLGRGIGHAAFGWIWPSNPWTASYRRERGQPMEGTAGWLSGACLLLRREAFAQVGGFDEGYFMYFEDTDLCERLARAGWDVVYAPSATVVHQGGHATSRHLDRMSKAHHDSAYRYLSRRYSGAAWAPVRAILRTGLWGRYQLSRRVRRVVHGAQPTRQA